MHGPDGDTLCRMNAGGVMHIKITHLLNTCGTMCLVALVPLVSGTMLGQNLVSNPGFEEVLQCPDFQSQLDRTAHWTSPSTQGSPDFYHVCATNPLYATPGNTVGFQEPVDGVAYTGIFLLIAQSVMAEWREYIQAPLLEPLIQDHCYRLRLYANLTEFSLLSTNSLGVRFTVGPYDLADAFVPGDQPHLALPPGTFLDHENWTVLEGEYVAQGGEDHLMIGNYAPDASTATQPVSSSLSNAGPFVYVLIDLVSLEPCKIVTGNGQHVDPIGPGYDLLGNTLELADARWAGGTCRLFDNVGRRVFESSPIAGSVHFPSHLAGIHVLELMNSSGEKHRRKVLLHGAQH